MTAAAFRATVHGIRTLPSRKVLQLTVECPIEELPHVAQIAEHGAWLAIARLIPEVSVPATSGQEREVSAPPAPLQPEMQTREQMLRSLDKPEKREWSELPMPAQAGMRCKDPEYWAFLSEMHNDGERVDADGAEEFVRHFCKVTSRSKILPATCAAEYWKSLERQFADWKVRDLADRIGA